MNFNEFKAVMCDLEDLNYIEIREYKDHCIVRVKKQENNETTDLISNKIIHIWENSGIIGGYEKQHGEFVFIETNNFAECFTEENYEKIVERIDKLNISFCNAYVRGKGVNKSVNLYIRNEYGNAGYSMKTSILDIIEGGLLPFDVYIDYESIQTKKGIEWEEKKMNCAEIKICEDFDKILSRF